MGPWGWGGSNCKWLNSHKEVAVANCVETVKLGAPAVWALISKGKENVLVQKKNKRSTVVSRSCYVIIRLTCFCWSEIRHVDIKVSLLNSSTLTQIAKGKVLKWGKGWSVRQGDRRTSRRIRPLPFSKAGKPGERGFFCFGLVFFNIVDMLSVQCRKRKRNWIESWLSCISCVHFTVTVLSFGLSRWIHSLLHVPVMRTLKCPREFKRGSSQGNKCYAHILTKFIKGDHLQLITTFHLTLLKCMGFRRRSGPKTGRGSAVENWTEPGALWGV